MDQSSEKNSDQRLDALLRHARQETADGPELDEHLLLRYVMGTATDDERAWVLAALATSEQLRWEILDRMETLGHLESPEAWQAFESVSASRVRDMRRRLDPGSFDDPDDAGQRRPQDKR